ncbi:MAG: redox-regulated ATPase YchF [Candidatus Aminicenantes bacterium]|nr:MAG: redox-regulated ATPase YchF [Candidatus Aminicenantes bacterium]
MNFTLFGFPKSGKTTLFNLLTGAKIEVKAFESEKKEPNLRTCPVPDERLEKLWSLYQEKKKIPTAVDYTDLAGISYGEIKNEAYLNNLRKADGLTHVVRGFLDAQIPHFKEKISPKDDILSIEEELILADLVSIESRLEKLEKELKRSKNPEGEQEKELLEKLNSLFEEGRAIRELSLSSSEEKLIRSFAFLSQKPLLHMINVDEKDIPLIEDPERIYPTKKKGSIVLAFCGKIEMEILELEEEEKDVFLKEYSLQQLSSPKFLKASYSLLNVITFFTIGKEEVKAWTIKKNTTALNAAGRIHTDIERGFIRAEVISWGELLKYGSLHTAKENAAVRLEGKDYIVQDGDVIYFRFAK